MASWKILSGWRRPKWQHPDPAVRRRALLELGAGAGEAAEILRRLADDEAAEVREVAVKRLDDVEVLRRRLTDDPEPSVRGAAAVRYRQLLIAGLPSEAAIAELARCSDTAIPTHVARRARAPEVRRAALLRVESLAVLMEAALHDDDPDVRRNAVDRLETPEALETLLRRIEAHEETVHDPALEATVRSRLTALTDHDAVALCREMEALAEGEWSDALQARRRELAARWRALPPPIPKEMAERFRRATTACLLRRPPEHAAATHLKQKLLELLENPSACAEEWSVQLHALSRGVRTLCGAHPDEARSRVLFQTAHHHAPATAAVLEAPEENAHHVSALLQAAAAAAAQGDLTTARANLEEAQGLLNEE